MKNNPKRAPYTAQTKAKVREMRETGYSNVQITEATGVPGSTIARWAAEGKWRVSDLVNAQVSFSPEAKSPCACVSVGHSIHWIECDTSRPCMAPRSEGCRMNPPAEAPDGLLPGLGGDSWFGSRDPDGSHRTGSRLHAGNEDRDALEEESGLSARAGSVFSHDARMSSSPEARSSCACTVVCESQGSDDCAGLRAPNSVQCGSPERAPCDASASRGQTNTNPTKSRQQQLEDALEKAAVAAEDAIMRGNFAAAGKATQMADTLSRALERVRGSAVEEKPEGVFYTAEDIANARAELTRRFDRLAKTLRRDEMRS